MAREVRRVAEVLKSKRASTRFQVLAEVADNQPAISQQEISDAVGVTTQAVSEVLRELVEDGHVRKHGPGRYEVTNEGVDWLLTEVETLEAYLTHVSEEVLETVDHETAIATDPIENGEAVRLSMRNGTLHATPEVEEGDARAVAVTSADAGEDVGIAGWEGVIDYVLGEVTVVAVPDVRDGGSSEIDTETLGELLQQVDIVAAAGTEALAALSRIDETPDLTFGTPAAVQEAAARGLDVLLVCVQSRVGEHTERLREYDISHEVLELT